MEALGEGSSPHTRGALPGGRARGGRPGIIPAYAGSTHAWRALPRVRRDHPRIRGEHVGALSSGSGGAGSSPHTRGAHQRAPVCERHQGIIPAYAGSTDLATAIAKTQWGSSPHTRGAQRLRQGLAVGVGIIPAYAGSTSDAGVPPRPAADHPRIRGEHAQSAGAVLGQIGSSPHTRGAPRLGSPVGKPRGIIPAYAGSTGSTKAVPPRASDHPRIRGEHDADLAGDVAEDGSSPHTRGAPRSPRRRRAC